jgi:phenylpropionate dioxygenase-like ring-hydroxylating dioxygenase large terminal subunit|tara:strand:+ start:3879 stop:5222 length:1344 start_codon:yes stop_codon:yes gene_type:complete
MAVSSEKYNVIDLKTGQLDRRIFSDNEIYQEELENIFGRAWLMIGHESLVPKVNDYFQTYMGEDPVILTRDNKGKLHAFMNMCRHRGNRIVRADVGNAKNFMCSYHGWTYSNEGDLEYVPGEEEAYYGALDRDRFHLVEARLDTYAGIVFATWDSGAPSLEEYLGDARWALDVSFNRLDCGTEAIGPVKWIEPINWKTAVDNCSDNYHVPTTHLSAILAMGRHLGLPRLTHEQQFESPNKHLFINGHSMTLRFLERPDQARQTHGVTQENRALFDEYYKATLPEAERRLGKVRAGQLHLGNHSIFPNGVLGFRLAHPRGPLETEFWHFVVLEKDMPADLKRALRMGAGNFNGVAGLFEQDDMDNWRGVTRSTLTPMARKYTQDLSMGIGQAGPDPDFPGTVAERYTSENNQRNFYRRWEEFMNARDWGDIPIERSTAEYEGTAKMNG